MMKDNIEVAVIGLGYVGLPLANAFSKVYKVIGFDTNANKINKYKLGIDITNEIGNEKLKNSTIFFTNNENDIKNANVYIIAVPTPIDLERQPYIKDTMNATKLVGKMLKKGDLVIYESTFYPGMTEEKCIPLLEQISNMKQSKNFYVGYSPERINPGDKKHKLENITKIVSGIDEDSKEYVYELYRKILINEPYKVSSIKIAEASKILENTQRDVNIAFMNEMSKFLKNCGINTQEVIEACSTKWNFINFKPGLVGGHCIGIDPYYLIYKAETIGMNLKLIKESRNVNEEMKKYVLDVLLKKINDATNKKEKSIIIYGVTFKENVSDIRNSKIIEIAKSLEEENNIKIYISDTHVDSADINKEYNTNFLSIDKCTEKVQGIVIGTPHNEYKNMTEDFLIAKLENIECPILDINNIIKKNKNSKVWKL